MKPFRVAYRYSGESPRLFTYCNDEDEALFAAVVIYAVHEYLRENCVLPPAPGKEIVCERLEGEEWVFHSDMLEIITVWAHTQYEIDSPDLDDETLDDIDLCCQDLEMDDLDPGDIPQDYYQDPIPDESWFPDEPPPDVYYGPEFYPYE